MIDLLHSDGIDVIQIESRAKSVESFVEKLRLKGEKYENPLEDVTDLVGLRIITYYLEDVESAADLVRREFEVDETNSTAIAARLEEPDQFGYLSGHYVVSLNEHRRRLAEWDFFGTRRMEIQIRTALQHAWAAVSHKLDYKSANEAPLNLRRRLFRLSALFELADEQFSDLRRVWRVTDQSYRAEVRRGYLDMPIDSVSLGAYLNEAERIGEVRALLEEVGLPIRAKAAESRRELDRRDLLTTLRAFNFARLHELDSFLGSVPTLRRLASAYVKARLTVPAYTLEDLLTQLLMIYQPVDERLASRAYYDDQWPLLQRAIHEFHSSGKGTTPSGTSDR
jgi:ppGpp synthetase/RelA/SpoT-type nucleotidyltranferase